MPTGTTYNPTNAGDLQRAKLNFNAQGVTVIPTAGTSTNLDLILTDDSLITGAWLIITGGTPGDTMNFQVIDSTGAFSGTPGTVLNQFITNWYPAPETNIQLDMVYPAKILATMTLRVVYNSIGSTNPQIFINYKLHKVLA